MGLSAVNVIVAVMPWAGLSLSRFSPANRRRRTALHGTLALTQFPPIPAPRRAWIQGGSDRITHQYSEPHGPPCQESTPAHALAIALLRAGHAMADRRSCGAGCGSAAGRIGVHCLRAQRRRLEDPVGILPSATRLSWTSAACGKWVIGNPMAAVGATNGIGPRTGAKLMPFSPTSGVSADVHQLVDITAYALQIDAGLVNADLSVF